MERIYTVPLRKEFMKVPRYQRSKKAIKALKAFLLRHMKVEEIKLSRALNEYVWKDGIKNPPHHVKVLVKKVDDHTAKALLFGEKEESQEKEEKKQEKKENETKEETTPAKKTEEKQETKKEKETKEQQGEDEGEKKTAREEKVAEEKPKETTKANEKNEQSSAKPSESSEKTAK